MQAVVSIGVASLLAATHAMTPVTQERVDVYVCTPPGVSHVHPAWSTSVAAALSRHYRMGHYDESGKTFAPQSGDKKDCLAKARAVAMANADRCIATESRSGE